MDQEYHAVLNVECSAVSSIQPMTGMNNKAKTKFGRPTYISGDHGRLQQDAPLCQAELSTLRGFSIFLYFPCSVRTCEEEAAGSVHRAAAAAGQVCSRSATSHSQQGISVLPC